LQEPLLVETPEWCLYLLVIEDNLTLRVTGQVDCGYIIGLYRSIIDCRHEMHRQTKLIAIKLVHARGVLFLQVVVYRALLYELPD